MVHGNKERRRKHVRNLFIGWLMNFSMQHRHSIYFSDIFTLPWQLLDMKHLLDEENRATVPSWVLLLNYHRYVEEH